MFKTFNATFAPREAEPARTTEEEEVLREREGLNTYV